MHPSIAQALVAERAREWRDQAARYRLAAQAPRGQAQARLVRAERPGSRRPAPRPAQPVVMTGSAAQAADECQPVGGRAA